MLLIIRIFHKSNIGHVCILNALKLLENNRIKIKALASFQLHLNSNVTGYLNQFSKKNTSDIYILPNKSYKIFKSRIITRL